MDDNMLDREETQYSDATNAGALRDDDNMASDEALADDMADDMPANDTAADRFDADFRETLETTDQFEDEALQDEAESDFADPGDTTSRASDTM